MCSKHFSPFLATCVLPPFVSGVCNENIRSSRIPEQPDPLIDSFPFPITVYDPDNDPVMFSIRSVTPFTSSFVINNATGFITVSQMLDRETQSEYSLVIGMSDGLFEATFNIKVTVNDVNDNIPTPELSSYVASLIENSPINTTILSIVFNDPDEGDNAAVLFNLTVLTPHTYPIAPFAVLGNDNRIAHIVTTVEFDFELISVTQFNLEIFGYNSDGQGSSATIEVTILDDNDNVPTVNISDQMVAYLEGVDYISLPPTTVVDPDISPILCANVILEDAVSPSERLYIDDNAIPSGFVTSFMDNILYITGRGTPVVYSMLLSSIRYSNLEEEFSGSLTRNVAILVADRLSDDNATGSGSGPDDFKNISSSVDIYGSDSLVITLVPLNDPPEITCAPVSLDPIDEDDIQSSGQTVRSLFAHLISDNDNSDFGIALIQSPMNSVGQLQRQINANTGFTALLSASTTSAHLLGPDNLLRFVPATNVYGNFSFQFLAWDGTGNFTTLDNVDTTAFSDGYGPFSNTSCVADIVVNPVNDPPVIELGGAGILNISRTYVEGQDVIASIDVAPNASISDVDTDRYIVQLVVNISSLEYGCAGNVNSLDVIYCVNMSSIPIISYVERYGPSCIAYIFQGRHTIMEWQAVIQSCKFRIDDLEPSGHTRLLEYTVNDSEDASYPAYATIEIELQNDNCPELSINGAQHSMGVYTEHSGGVVITGTSLLLSDQDGGMIESAQVTITPAGVCSECLLRVNTGASNVSITQSFDQSTLNITGPASINDFEAVLQTLEFEDRSNEPDTSSVDIVITVSDGNDNNCPPLSPPNIIIINLMIIVVNDQAALFYPDGGNETTFETVFMEGGNPVPIIGIHATFVDDDFMPDSTQSINYIMTVTLEGNGCDVSYLTIPTITESNILHPYDPSNCSVTFTGSPNNLETDLMQVRFTSDSRNPYPLLQRVSFSLQDVNFTTYSFTDVTIIPVNDRPIVDLNVTNSSYPNTNIIYDISAGVTSVAIVGSMGSLITDVDNDSLQSLTLTLQEFTNTNNMVTPRTDGNRESIEIPSNLTAFGLSSSGFSQVTSTLVINGQASLIDYTTVLDAIVYQNLQPNPTTNIRRVTVVADDGNLTSIPVRATILFVGENHPPILENVPTENVKYFANDPAITITPDILINEPDDDLICTTRISGTCDMNSFDFSDIMYPDLISFDNNNGTLVLHTTPFSCLLSTTFSSILRSIKYFSSSEGICTMTIQVTELRGLVSNVESIVIETLIRNIPPRVDLDLGAPGAGFATQYLQGVTPVHIVSIFNATLNSTISPQFFEGEAMGEVGEAPSTNESSIPTIALSHAGFLLEDDDDKDLVYLRAAIVNSSTSIDDVLVFPCIDPSSTDVSIETARGCDNRVRSRVIVGRYQYSPNITTDCSRGVDICSGLRVEVACPYTGYKRYTCTYTDGNSSIVRFRALLGCIGYEYLVEVGGNLNHERSIDVTAYDGTDITNVGTTKVQLLESNRLLFDPLKETISICEGEKPSDKCIYFVARPKLITGQLADPATVQFTIISGNNDTGNKFAINDNGGIYLVNSLDRETRDNYTLSIRAVNLVGEAILTLCISVEDVNDNHPIIPQSFKAEVPEGIANAVVIQLNATDKDEGSNAELMYFIVGYGSDKFTIDNNGVIRTSEPLSTGDMYMLVVIVTDRGDIIRHRNDTYKYTDNDNGGLYLSSHTIVAVDVTQRFLPNIMITPANSSISFVENQNVMTVVASFEAINNETLLSDNIQYTIVSIEPNNPPAAFDVKGISPGRADVITNAILDAELVVMYSIIIMASNTTTDQVNPGYAYLTVIVTDENDNIPQFIDLPSTIFLFEDTPTNTVVLSFMVSDNDISNTLFSFDLSGSFSFGIASIEQIRSEQSLTNVSILLNVPLDYEHIQDGYLNITVFDSNDPAIQLSNSASVYITVIDVNDNAPVPLSDPILASIIETATNGTEILNISNTFTDVDTVGEFVFFPITFRSVPFCIDGELLVVCQPDILTTFEQNSSYTFSFNILNSPLPPVNVNVSVGVELVNEFPPLFTSDVYSFTVPENSIVGITVGTVTANDDDGGDHGVFNYFADIATLPFVVDSQTGIITTNGEAIDRENTSFYSFLVNATDNPLLDGFVQFTTVTQVIINVEDLNDNPPVFVNAPYTITVQEHPGNDYLLLQFSITDEDTPNASNLLVSLPASVPFLYLYSNDSYVYSILVNDSDALDYDAGPQVIVFNIVANDIATTSGDESHEVTAMVTIILTNINDVPPVINGPAVLRVNEVSGNGNGTIDPVLVGQIDATDGDMNMLSYSILANECTENVPITVNSTTGELFLCVHIDYEIRTNYSLTVEVFDGRFYVNRTIPVEVIDRNDNPPIFAEPIVFIVSENSSTGIFIGAIAHTDGDSFDNSMVNYIGLNVPETFRVSSSGRLYVNNSSLLDQEIYSSSYTFDVLAENPPHDPTDETQLVNITITVNVTDVNEHPPVVGECQLSVEENSPSGDIIGTLNVTDLDPSTMLYFVFLRQSDNTEITECTASFPFQVAPNTGEVRVCNAIDYERNLRYLLIFNVTDGITPRIGECTVTVTDVNDFAPVISPANETLSVSELTTRDSLLLEFSITDGDRSPIYRTVTSFNIVPSSVPFYLLGNDTNLRLFLNDTLDYETIPSYLFHIVVSNEELVSEPAEVQIYVINDNDLYPQFNRFSFNVSIFENVSNSYELLTVMAIDPDMANGSITYDVDPPTVPFAMVNNILSVVRQEDIDYDSGIRVYHFSISATDSPVRPNGTRLTSYLPGEVHILDINDNAPKFDVNSLNYTVREDAMDEIFGMVRAMDDDSGINMEITYSVILPDECLTVGSGSGSGMDSMTAGFCTECFPFTIDSSSGNLTKCGPLDFEKRCLYSFQVVATDMGSPSMSAVGIVFVNVENVNDNSPVINNHMSLQKIVLMENETLYSPVTFINATDDDYSQLDCDPTDPDFGVLVYETQISGVYMNCTDEVPFTINENGYLILCQPLDYETVRNYSFNIVVYDGGDPVLSDAVSVIVTVLNVNDNEPVIESSLTAAVIEEQPDAFVIDVEAIDPDAPQFPIVSYQLTNQSLVNFTINETTGEIWTRNSVDREVQEYIIITVIVNDQDFSVHQDITITIIDINDNDPVVLSDPIINVTENTETVITIVATDPDIGINSLLVFSLVNASNVYSIDAYTGDLTIQPLDRDPSTGGTPQVTVDISIRDSGSPIRSVNFTQTIDIIDVNDNVPLFSGDTTITLDEGTPTGTIVYTVTATDYDEGSNSDLTYSVISGTPLLDFIPGTPQLEVIEVPTLNGSEQLTTSLIIQIQDWNVNPSNRSTTLVTLSVIIQSPSPRFPDVFVFNVDENANGTVGYPQATVRGIPELLNYTIVKELPFGNFAIDSNGSLSAPSCCLDYEDAESYMLVIEATIFNDTSLSDTTNVDIALTNVNEHAPVLFPVNLTGTINEDAYNGTNVVRALAIDLDFDAAGEVSYVVNDSSIFDFDDATGYLKVIDPNALDHENQTEYILQYQARDNGNPARYSEVGYITIRITNIDDVPPSFTMDTYRAEINETVIVGFLVLEVSATDIDTPQQDLVYSLSPPQTDFAIDGSGIIVTRSLDHETKPVYQFSVVVTDTQGLYDTANVSIILFDNNDNRPLIRPEESVIIIHEVDRYARLPEDLSIVHSDNTAKFPVVSVTASLRSTNNLSFPISGGFCDHANYSRLYQGNTAKLCGSGADNLIDYAAPEDLVEPGVLDLGNLLSDLVVIGNRQVAQSEVQSGFCLCMWINIPARFKSIDAGQQLFRFNPRQNELSPLRLLIRNNIFEVGVQNMFNNEDFTELISISLTDDSYPDFIDGSWHHLCINYNGSSMTLRIDGEVISTNDNVTIPSFSEASPLLGELLSGYVSHLYFQSNEMCTDDVLMCLLTCGEWLDIDNATTYEDVAIDLNYHQRSIVFTYTGDDNANSTVQLDKALQSIRYYSILEEPHPLDRLITIEASDMVGGGDPSFVIARPDLINDQVPILDINGVADYSAPYQTTYIEDSAGIQIISPDVVLYDLDSGYWRVFEIKVNITADVSNNILGILEVVGTLQAPLQAVMVSPTCVVINATDGSTQFPELFTDALTKVHYRNPEDEPSLTTTRIEFSVNDSIFTGPRARTIVTIQPANDPPIIDLNVNDVNTINNSNTFREQDGQVIVIPVGSALNISDTDGNMLSGAVVTIVNRPDDLQESLSIDANPVTSITTESYDSSTGELRLTGIGSFNDYLTLLRTVRYHNVVPGSPDTTTRLISFVVTDGIDPTSGSMPAYIFISIELFNDVPNIYLDGNSDDNFNFTYVEDSNCVVLFPNAIVFDLDETQRIFSTVTLSGDYSTGESITINVSNSNVMMANRLSTQYFLTTNTGGDVAIQAIEDVYRNIYYCNYDDEPENVMPRTLSITIREITGVAISTTVTATINIMQVNDQPTITITRQDEAAIRNESAPIIDVDSFSIDDSDDVMFDQMIIIIVNPINSPSQEIIDFEDIRLPAETFIQGPIISAQYPGYQYFVEFRGTGADFTKLRNTIAVLGYRNTAPASEINTDVPRNICVVVRDFKEFSLPSCVSVTISPINQFTPIFVNSSGGSFRISENNDLVALGFVNATDDDDGLAGIVRYSITVYNSSEEVTGLVGIDSVNGYISLLTSLDAELYRQLFLTIVASDQGNPQRSSDLNITLFIEDENDVVPELSIVILVSIIDGQGNGIRVAEITATDGDSTSPNNMATTFSIVNPPLDSNGAPLFSLVEFNNGRRVDLILNGIADREVTPIYFVNVSVRDSGNPSNIAYQVIEIPVIDENDQRPVIHQIIEGRYVVGSPIPASIGPVTRIIDLDESPEIHSVEIILNPSTIDLGKTFANCEDQRCQSERMEECGLIRPGSFDVIRRSEFTLLFVNTSSTTGCNSVRLDRGIVIESSGLGVLPGSNFPSGAFVNFTFTFVATQEREGYPFVINADTLGPGDTRYDRYLGLWIRHRRFDFFYSYFTSSGIRVFTQIDLRSVVLWDRNEELQRRHIAVVVQGTNFKIYVNCREVVDETLEGIIADPPPNTRMEIGHPEPTTLSNGRYEGELSDFYYHSYSMSVGEILCTCSCGSEQLVLPNSLPQGITATINSDLTNVLLTASPSVSLPIMEEAIRAVGYINTFSEPDRTNSRRQLDFFLDDGENSISESPTDQYVLLVNSDDNTPIITITGDSVFVEDFDPVSIVSDAIITRRDGLVPAIFNMTVTLLNLLDAGEQLSGEDTSVINVEGVGTTMLTLSGSATPDNYTDALRLITYFNPADVPNTNSVRMIEFCANGHCSSSRAEVTVRPTNDDPIVSILSSTVASYVEGSDPILFAITLQITDVDSNMLSSAQVFIQTSPAITEDILDYSNINGLEVTRLSNNSISITGSAPITTYEDILRNITFSTSYNPLLDDNGNPTIDTTRVVMFVVNDSNGGTSPPTGVRINFIPEDSPPEIITTGFAVFRDNDASVLLDPNITITDRDNERLLNLSLQLMGAGINEALRYMDFIDTSLTFNSDSRTAFTEILRNTIYINGEEEPELGNRSVLITVCDFSSCTATNITVEVRDVNDINPRFNRPSYNITIREDTSINTAILTVTATDMDRGEPIFSFEINDTSSTFNIRKINPAGNIAEIVLAYPLNFEIRDVYEFTIIVNDGGDPELEGSSTVTIVVGNVNENPILDLSANENTTFNQTELTRFVPAPGTSVRIFRNSISISDVDRMDGISEAHICINNYQLGDILFLNSTITVTSEYAGGCLTITRDQSFSAEEFEQLLGYGVYYERINVAEEGIGTVLRTICATVSDNGGLVSNNACVSLSLADLPVFNQAEYVRNLTEGVSHANFLTVTATVQGEHELIQYRLEDSIPWPITITTDSGVLSLTAPLDYEDSQQIIFEVYAIDPIPPARTATATVMINLIDINDNPPGVICLDGNVTVNSDGTVDVNVILIDNDTSPLTAVTIELRSDFNITTNPFTQNTCLDVYNAFDKMRQACGLNSSVEDLIAASVTDRNDSKYADEFGNEFLRNFYTQSHATVQLYDISGLQDNFSELTFAVWIRIFNGQSGYIISITNPDGSERYFAVYFNANKRQIIVYLKDPNNSGRSSILSTVFQLQFNLDNGRYHFVMIYIQNGEVNLIIDQVPITSKLYYSFSIQICRLGKYIVTSLSVTYTCMYSERTSI